jgi:hypothetical protein
LDKGQEAPEEYQRRCDDPHCPNAGRVLMIVVHEQVCGRDEQGELVHEQAP